MSYMVDHSERKFVEFLLLLASRLENEPAAGTTKLNKLAFYSEFAHVRMTGQPITGIEYQRLENGPAPRRLLPVRKRMIEAGDADLREEVLLGYTQHRLVPKRGPDLSLFGDTELQAIEDVLRVYGSDTGTSLSVRSHDEPPWNVVADGQIIPYQTAFLRKGTLSKRVREHARHLAQHN